MLRFYAPSLASCAVIFAVSVSWDLSYGADKAAESPPAAKLPAEEKIRQSLSKTVTLAYSEAPLTAICVDLETKLGVPVRLDPVGTKDAGVDPDTAVTFSISNVSARAAIFHLLSALKLRAIIKHETLWITSPQAAESDDNMSAKVYDVADLVGSGDTSDESPDFSQLKDLMVNTVDQKTWLDNGGVASIGTYSAPGIRALVICQTEEEHCRIKDLLAQLRGVRAARARPAKGSAENRPAPHETARTQTTSAASPVRPELPTDEAAIRLALEKPIEVHVVRAEMNRAVQILANTAALPIVADASYKEGEGLDAITIEASGRSLRSILDEITQSHKLTWTYSRESLLILSKKAEEEQLITRVYDLSDLPSYRNRRGEAVPDYASVKELITGTIDEKSWLDNGGNGTLLEYDKAGIRGIVVSQTWKAHLKIEGLLEKLRRLRAQPLSAEEIKNLPLPPEPENPASADLPPRVVEHDALRDAVVAANNQFALDLHKKLHDENRVFSPSSICAAMAMVYSGARGKTADEIAKALHFRTRAEDVVPGYQSLLVTLPSANHPGCTLTVANRLWGQQGYAFREPFLTTIRDGFGGGLAQVDFLRPGPACDQINAWADKQTAGKIGEIVDSSMIAPEARFILTNAVYFKGLWAEPFKKSETRTGPFYTAAGSVDVPFMHRLTQCRYGRFGKVQVLEKPYRGGEVVMTIALPENEPGSLDDLENSLSAAKLDEWTSKLVPENVDVFLPKFKLEVMYPLTPALTALGMTDVFDRARADLSGINGGNEPLWLAWVVQKAYINVDEEGTEAAAVTGSFGGGGIEPKRPIFRADHPFLFFVRDTRTGCIYFMGRLAKPEK